MNSEHTKHLTLPIFSASFIFSWVVWGTLILTLETGFIDPGTPGFMVLFVLGGLGPTIMPLVLIWRLLPRDEAGPLVKRRLFGFRIPGSYYLLAVGLTAGFFAVHYAASYLLAGGYVRYGETAPWYQLFLLFPVMIIGGGLEEIGWRGIGVPELFERLNPFRGTLIIGAVWMAWHIPLFFIQGTSQYGSDFISFAAMGFSFSLILAPLMYFSGSAVPCIISHALFNAFYGTGWLYPVANTADKRILDLLLLLTGAAVWLVWFSLEKRRVSSV
ncbi:MAG: CPBP family intramembrane glutamic endopeptidase [Spirochaetota bacterium]